MEQFGELNNSGELEDLFAVYNNHVTSCEHCNFPLKNKSASCDFCGAANPVELVLDPPSDNKPLEDYLEVEAGEPLPVPEASKPLPLPEAIEPLSESPLQSNALGPKATLKVHKSAFKPSPQPCQHRTRPHTCSSPPR